MANYKIDLINNKNSEYQLLGKNITAVFLIAFNEKNEILSCRNERGWDVPGGHIEQKESLEEGLLREVQEETGASFNNPIPFALLTLEGVNKSMLFYDNMRI